MQRKADTSPVLALIATVWISGFLWFFFRSPIEDPHLLRSELWSMMADEVLGLSDAASDPAGTDRSPGSGFFRSDCRCFHGPQRFSLLLQCMASHVFALTLRRCRLLLTEQAVIRLGTGLGSLSTVTLCCGVLGQLTRSAIIVPALASLAVSCFIRWKSRNESRAPHTQVPADNDSSRILRILTLMVIVPFGVYLVLGAVSPPTDFDVREYHLQGPKEWFQQGRILFLPHNVYTSFPFLTRDAAA